MAAASGTYLDSIVAWHRARAAAEASDVANHRSALRDAVAAVQQGSARRDFAAALRTPGLSVIAEVKRRSPSKGPLAPDLDPVETAREYESGGAACVSVLTDANHFGGSIDDLQAARAAITLPVIRKDFTVCEADVYQTALIGADCVLLIVAVLTDSELESCAAAARFCGLDVLWETHDELEVKRALAHEPTIIGVNQRDLHTFAVDQARAVRVAASIPSNLLRVAESGVRGPDDAAILFAAGYDGVLVGESVVTSGNRSQSVRALIEAVEGIEA